MTYVPRKINSDDFRKLRRYVEVWMIQNHLSVTEASKKIGISYVTFQKFVKNQPITCRVFHDIARATGYEEGGTTMETSGVTVTTVKEKVTVEDDFSTMVNFDPNDADAWLKMFKYMNSQKPKVDIAIANLEAELQKLYALQAMFAKTELPEKI